LFFAAITSAQVVTDTVNKPVVDSMAIRDTAITKAKDSLQIIPVSDSVSKRPPVQAERFIDPAKPVSSYELSWQILQHHPYFGFSTKSETAPVSAIRTFRGKEGLFYLLVFLLITYGLLRLVFPKYFSDLFRLFFRTTLKQRQISEQLMQTPLPSLLLNGFFVFSTGLYIAFVLQHFKLDPFDNFWLLFLYCCLGLSAIYFIKFIGLKISGWIFNMKEAADSYVFIVFVVNKMIGILLLPFLILLAFALGDVYSVAFTMSFCIVAGLIAYRFILSFAAIRNQVRVNPFHFFLYLCAFEIAPLLLIYKGLLVFFPITT
jgi:Domain of unknown function (DUF4271)